MSFEKPAAIVRNGGLSSATARARAAFVALEGEQAAARRQVQIAHLPIVEWKGRLLYTVRCDAQFGKGPHDVNVPEHVLWALLDLRAFRCPFHQ